MQMIHFELLFRVFFSICARCYLCIFVCVQFMQIFMAATAIQSSHSRVNSFASPSAACCLLVWCVCANIVASLICRIVVFCVNWISISEAISVSCSRVYVNVSFRARLADALRKSTTQVGLVCWHIRWKAEFDGFPLKFKSFPGKLSAQQCHLMAVQDAQRGIHAKSLSQHPTASKMT